jgi:hypothetical protein
LQLMLDVWVQFLVRSLKCEGVCCYSASMPGRPSLPEKS